MGIKTPMRPMDIRIPIEYGEVLMPHAKEKTCFIHYHHDQMQYGAGRWKELCFFLLEKSSHQSKIHQTNAPHIECSLCAKQPGYAQVRAQNPF
jgi:hypothetical protein